MTGYTKAVAEEVEDLRAQFADKAVTAEPDGAGGAYVVIDTIDPGPAYQQRESWLGFQITYLCPDADIYPVFLRGDLVRVDGKAHAAPFAPAKWHGRDALQYSLKSAQRNPEIDTAAIKAAGVIACLADRQ
jgi:hypothetical protein